MQQAYFRLRLLCDHREICGQVSIITIPCNATRVSVSIFLSAPSGLSRRSPLSLALAIDRALVREPFSAGSRQPGDALFLNRAASLPRRRPVVGKLEPQFVFVELAPSLCFGLKPVSK